MRMKQCALSLAVVLGTVITAGLPSSAVAGPTPHTTLKLVCDRGTGIASATVQLQGSIFGPNIGAPIVLSCGPDSLSGARSETIVDANPGVGAASYDLSISTVLGAMGCFGSGARPLKASCTDANSVGATLIVR